MVTTTASTTASTASITSPTLARAPGRFAIGTLTAGGLLMVAMYALEIVQGLQTGETMTLENAAVRPLLYISGFMFGFALIAVALGLAGIGLVLRAHAPRLATAAVVLPLLAALAPIFNMLAPVVGMHGVPALNALSVLANLASATLLGIAALRTRALPRMIGSTLLAVGLITFPLILLTIPAASFLPEYVVQDIPFPVWGAIFVGIGAALWRGRGIDAA